MASETNEVAGVVAIVDEKKMRDSAIVVVGIAHDFGHRTIAMIEIAGEAGISREVWRIDPLLVIAQGIGVTAFKPGVVGAAGREVGVKQRQNHGGEKGRLGAREVIGAIGVQDAAVVIELEEEVFDHALGEGDALIAEQAQNDEIAVPTIHFVELAAGNDVRVFEVEQAFILNAGEIHLLGQGDELWEMADVEAVALLQVADGRGLGKFGGEIEDGFFVGFGIAVGLPARQSAGEGIPTRGDELASFREADSGIAHKRGGGECTDIGRSRAQQWYMGRIQARGAHLA